MRAGPGRPARRANRLDTHERSPGSGHLHPGRARCYRRPEFDEQDRLVDFTSDDRQQASSDGKTLQRKRWFTPLRNYRSFHGRTISTSGRACWDTPDEGQFTYLESEVDDITYGGFGRHRVLAGSVTTIPAGVAVTVEKGAVGAPGDPVRP